MNKTLHRYCKFYAGKIVISNFIRLAIVFSFGCNDSLNKNDRVQNKVTDNRKPIELILEEADSIFIRYEPIAGSEDWNLVWGSKNFTGIEKISTLTNGHGSNIPPVVKSFDNNYIELRTTGSANYFETLILPVRQQFMPKFFRENILLLDRASLQVLTFHSDVHNQEDNFTVKLYDLEHADFISELKMLKCESSVGFPWIDTCFEDNGKYVLRSRCGDSSLKH